MIGENDILIFRNTAPLSKFKARHVHKGRSFSAAATTFVWNSLPDHVGNCASVGIFKS